MKKIELIFDGIWKKIKVRREEEILIFVKEGDKEFIAHKEGFAIKCKAGDLKNDILSRPKG